jgi:hypothetical protein
VLPSCVVETGLGQFDDEVNGLFGLELVFNPCDEEGHEVDMLEFFLEINQNVDVVKLWGNKSVLERLSQLFF